MPLAGAGSNFLCLSKEKYSKEKTPRCSLLPNARLFPATKVGVMRHPGAAHLKNASMHFFLWMKENALGALKGAPIKLLVFDCAAAGEPLRPPPLKAAEIITVFMGVVARTV